MKLRLITLLAIALITKLNVEAQQNSERPRLMAKSGPHQVGHVSFEWTDKARKELSTKDESDSRIVPVQIWYPAKAGVKGEMTAYRPRLASFKNQWEKETIDFVSSVQTGVIQEAMINQGPSFPVFIFSHGWNSKSSSYGTLLSNLASYGIIVVGMNHPYMGTVGMLDGTVAQADDSNFDGQAAANKFYAQDVSFILDKLTELSSQSGGRFEGKMDISKVIAGGHSSGFPAASGAAVNDRRIKGLISFDSGVPKIVREKGLDVPIFLFRADTLGYTDLFFRGENVHPKGTIYDVNFFRKHRANFYDLVISGSTHSSVYDEYLYAEDDEEKELSLKIHRMYAEYANAFIRKILLDTKSDLMESEKTESVKLRIIDAQR